ncbi:glycosyltransferase [Leptolyngbya sp. FACHB-17]|uniref:glycosyltransferase family 2 protein n=1 Tax=unclassified Leptolyngbya TaxID=2650499 RepID=UPI0016805BDB|nr:glycosyltransferase [Leptolyngbya sp. FACHB-17]MBD2079179.1 glycosyltransferase family 2 protein [Leptolyngbya sp. FACHB-17]
MMNSTSPALSVCVASRNRPDDVIRCLNSLTLLQHVEFEILLIDDASEAPIGDRVLPAIDPILVDRLQVFRHENNKGIPATRNELAERAKAPYLLYLDDDAQLLSAESVDNALTVLKISPEVGAVALSQSDETGKLLPGQPLAIEYRCYAPTFVGYGSLLRRDLFLELGGYREMFAAYYEEPEFCKRMLDRGFYVVYLPDACVIHYKSPIGRNNLVALRNNCRNKCFAAIYNEPSAMMVFSIPLRILLYVYKHWAYCRQHKIKSEFGASWIVREIQQNLPALWRDRRALKWSTYYKWHKIKQAPAYQPAD